MGRRHVVASALSIPLVAAAAACSPPAVRARVELPPATTQQQVGDLRVTPELERLVEELSREASQGVVGGLSEAETKERLHAVVGELTRVLLDEIAASAHGPAAREATAGMTKAMLRSFSDELESSVGPAMRRMVVDELLRQPDFRRALNETSRDVGRQVAFGSAEGVAEAARTKKARLLPLAADLLPAAVWPLILLVVGLALGIPLVVLSRRHRAARLYRQEAERRTAVIAALLKAVEAEHDDPALKKVLAQITASLTAEGARPVEAPPEPPRQGTLHPA